MSPLRHSAFMLQYFLFLAFHFDSFYSFSLCATLPMYSCTLPTFFIRSLIITIVILNLHSEISNILLYLSLVLMLSLCCAFCPLVCLVIFSLNPVKIHSVKRTEVNRPSLRGFMFIWLGVRLSLLFAIGVDFRG